ncbi:OmpP1/FadL family transporter [Rickettsiales bacterium]|nr:OmpP1/FadL family transporter [Rickettsiales bacterium]
MKNKKLIIASIAFISSNALAAGYSTNTTSTAALATSYAGSSTGSHDISNMQHNPAILSKFDKQFIASISYLDVDIDPQNSTIDNATADEIGDAGVNVVIPAFYFSTPIAKDTNLGLLVNSPFGLATEYSTEWAGKNFVNDTGISTVNLGTKLSHKLTDKLSVGLGFNAQKIKYTTTFQHPLNGYAKFKGSDWGYGYSLGLNYDLCDRLSLGAGYQSKVKHEVTGKYQDSASIVGDAVIKIATPESANIGAKYAINDKLNLMSDISWTRWSRNNTSTLQNVALPPFVYKWNDSFMYSLGGDYQYNNDLLIRFGGAFETGASTDAYRTADVPTGDVYWLNAGINYDLGNDLSVDATYLHQFYENVKINNTSSVTVGNLKSQYRTQVNLFSVALKKNF